MGHEAKTAGTNQGYIQVHDTTEPIWIQNSSRSSLLSDLCPSCGLGRGSIPAKVGFWVGLRMFSYVCTPTKLTNAITKTELLGKKRGGSRQKYSECGPFFVFGVFSGF